jgi:type III pantothenate kinase
MNEMRYLVDIGNTRIKWAALRDGDLGPVAAVPHNGGIGFDLASHWSELPRPRAVRVANVVGPEMEALVCAAAERLWKITPQFAQSSAQAHGVTNAYRDPARLGVDRWLAMVAAFRLVRTSVVVVDAGTAVTLDLLDAGGSHLGGLIVPGAALMRECLYSRTRIPPAPAQTRPGAFGDDTASCIAAGALQAIAGMIERTYRQATERLGKPPELVLTGSDSLSLRPRLAIPCRVDPNLVLLGLSLVQD